MPNVVRIEGNVEWRVLETEGGYLGDCDSLNVVVEAETSPELYEAIGEAITFLLHDLYTDGELENFLQDRGWVAHGELNAESKFDIPLDLLNVNLVSQAHNSDIAQAAG